MSAILLFSTFALPSPAGDKTGPKELQGEWIATHYEDRVGAVPVDAKKPHRLSIKGNRYTFINVINVMNNEIKTSTGTFTTDPAKTPKHIDLKSDKGGDGAVGIYELKGNELTLLIVPPESDRPTEFKADRAVAMLFKFKKGKK
jgi:uncharacterized protein (TIGR03067 family)